MPLVSASDLSSKLLASKTLGVTSFAILMFISNHVFLSFDRGTLMRFCVVMVVGMRPGRSSSWKVLMDGVLLVG